MTTGNLEYTKHYVSFADAEDELKFGWYVLGYDPDDMEEGPLASIHIGQPLSRDGEDIGGEVVARILAGLA